MERTNEYTSEIICLIGKAKEHNPKIGNYQEHFIKENFNYLVRLNNGTIEISILIAKDFNKQKSSVSDDNVKKIAKTFKELN